jgi:ribosomal protein S18 acetylase RimI-like enzyme
MARILRYTTEHEDGLLAVLGAEPDWSSFVGPGAIDTFKAALLNSETYVCESQGAICGYVRALVDGFGIYVSELYVAPPYRGNGYGKQLLEMIRHTHADEDVYVLSDEDPYYEKLGYTRVGSVFKL